ncbi:unnamed protein product, partial [Rangifer tarandus platyrhynchus]
NGTRNFEQPARSSAGRHAGSIPCGTAPSAGRLRSQGATRKSTRVDSPTSVPGGFLRLGSSETLFNLQIPLAERPFSKDYRPKAQMLEGLELRSTCHLEPSPPAGSHSPLREAWLLRTVSDGALTPKDGWLPVEVLPSSSPPYKKKTGGDKMCPSVTRVPLVPVEDNGKLAL